MDTVHNAIAWYQKKIGSYDKQLWEESVERKLLKVPPIVKNAPKKSVRLKTEYIDVDLIRGSTFTKTKPQVPWIYITRKAVARVIFFPFYYKWWVLQTSLKLYLLLLVLYLLQIISIIVYLRNLDHSIVEDELSFTEVTLPVILMFLLCLVHSQTVLAHIGHKPPKRTKPIPRVIRQPKTKKTTRKGHRSSGNNSSACQDESVADGTSTSTSKAGKSNSRVRSKQVENECGVKNESFSFPEMSKSNYSNESLSNTSKAVEMSSKSDGSSEGQGTSELLTKDNDCERFRLEREECQKEERSSRQDENALHGSSNTMKSHSDYPGSSQIGRISKGKSDNQEEVLDRESDGNVTQQENDRLHISTPKCDQVSSPSSSEIPCSCLLVESCDKRDKGNNFEKEENGIVERKEELNCFSCRKRRPSCAVLDNVCIHNDNPADTKNVEVGDEFYHCAGVVTGRGCCVDGHSNTEDMMIDSKYNSSSHSRGEESVISECRANDKNSDKENLGADVIGVDSHSHPILAPDSGIHSNVSSDSGCSSSCYHLHSFRRSDSHCIIHHTPTGSGKSECKPTSNAQMLESPLSLQSKVVNPHSKVANGAAIIVDHNSISLDDNGIAIFCPSISRISTATTTVVPSDNKKVISSDKNTECPENLKAKNLLVTSSSSSLLSSAASSSSFCQNCIVKCVDKVTKENDSLEKYDEKDLICKNSCHLGIICHCHHHQHHHQHPLSAQAPATSVMHSATSHNPNCSHSHSLSTSSTSSSSSAMLSTPCGIQSFSEQFVQEILNPETLREVSSTILLASSDLDGSSSSFTGPLSSASYSSSSSYSNQMLSVHVPEASSPSAVTTEKSLSNSVSTTPLSTSSSSAVTLIDKDIKETSTTTTTNQSIITTTPTTTTTSNSSYLNLPKRRQFTNRLPIQIENGTGNDGVTVATSHDESMEMLVPSDVERVSDISNYSPSESDSDAPGLEDLRNRCEEKRKRLRFQDFNNMPGTSGSLSPHMSGSSYKLENGTPTKSNNTNGVNVSRSMVNALTRKPSPLKDLSLSRKLNGTAQVSTHSSASDVGKSESTARSCLRRRRRTSGNTGDVDAARTRSVPSTLGIHTQDKNKIISSSENEGGEGYVAGGSNKAAMSSEEWEDRIPLDESTSSNYSSSCDNSESEVTRDGEDMEEEEEKTEYTTSTLHVINLLQPQSGSPSNSGNNSPPDKVSCLIWEMNECKKVDLTALDIGWAIIDKVDSLPESSDYFLIGVLFSVLMGVVPLAFRGFVNKSWTNMEDLLSWSGLINKTLDIPNWFLTYTWRQNLLMFNGILQRFFLSLLFFFLLSVADRTFKQRLLYAKHFSYLTSSRRARKFSMPHFRLNKVRNIKIWLSLRSYLKRRGPQRSVDVIVSASFMCGISVVCLISLQMLKDSGNYLDFLCNWELLVWCLALAVFLLRFMTLGLKINKKYRNLSVLITEQINLYLQMEQKPHKKEELVLANNVLRLAEDLLKELESPFKISGFSANPFIYNITKVIVLSAFSAVLTELLGFKLKLHKIKLKG